MDRIAGSIVALSGIRRLAVAMAAGALSSLALAPFGLFPLLFATIPVFVWLIDGAVARGAGRGGRFRASAAVGWWFGFGYFLGGLWWLGAALLVDGVEFAWMLPLAVLLVPAGLALFYGLGAGVAGLFWRPGWRRVLVLAVGMTGGDWLKGHILTGFPWNAFGYTLAPSPVMMQSAALVGLWGLTLLAFLVFAAPAAFWGRAGRRSRGDIGFTLLALALFALHVAYGAARLHFAEAAGRGPGVRIVQPALDQSEKWEAQDEAEVVGRYLGLSGGATLAGGAGSPAVTILVWPESAFPFLLDERPEMLAAIAALLPPGTTLVTGAVRANTATDDPEDAFNSVLVVGEDGEIGAAYDKVRLVPFGEYLPLRPLLERLGLRQIVEIPAGFTPGEKRLTLSLDGAPPFAPLICYEMIFPGAVVPSGARPGWLLNLTNDGWFGDTPGPYQHFHQARLRAVEEGLPLVRAANTGISAIVDPYGRIEASLGLGLAGAVNGTLPAPTRLTPYARLGDWIVLILAVACGILARGKLSVSQG